MLEIKSLNVDNALTVKSATPIKGMALSVNMLLCR